MPNVSLSLQQDFKTVTKVRDHTLIADEPEGVGGGNAGPAPSEMLLSAIGSCMAITMRLYANRKEWPLERVDIDMGSKKVQPEECPDYNNRDDRKQITVITSRIRLHGPLSNEQKTRIAEIGGRCPVHKVVAEGAHFVDELAVD
jgi:putative redox protein